MIGPWSKKPLCFLSVIARNPLSQPWFSSPALSGVCPKLPLGGLQAKPKPTVPSSLPFAVATDPQYLQNSALDAVP